MTRDILLARWNEVGDKIITMAEAFPETRYDTRPLPEVRSFAEQLRHVAFWNAYTGQMLRGEPADGEANELPRDAYPTKAEIVPALRETFDAVTHALASAAPDAAKADTVIGFIEHGGEHYGQLAVYYRLNGLVPPASR